MAVFFAYTFALRGTQTTIDGAPVNYAYAPNGTWQYSGDTTYFVVEENDGASVFNGDGDANEFVDTNERFGGAWEQTAVVDGVERQIIWDYTFTVTDNSTTPATTWRIGVIDVDLNNDNDVSDTVDGESENGYFLVFPDGMPPPGTPLTTGGIVENDDSTSHTGLGAQIVCFAAGTQIDTPYGPVSVEALGFGDLVVTAYDGPQPVQWAGATTVAAQGDQAPIVITAGSLGNTTDLVVSPQHCILLSDWRAELFYGQDEVLVRAVDLLNMDGVYRHIGGLVTYCHILMDKHQIVSAHGLWSETLYPGSVTMDAVGPEAQAEISSILPDIAAYGPTAAQRLRSFEAQLLAA